MYEKAAELYGYHMGDEIQVNGIEFYVIADSPLKQDYVVALKKEPLTVADVNLYGGVGTDNNHVNKYTQSSVGTTVNISGFGAVAYYSGETCGYFNGATVTTNCIGSYDDSDIKYIIDNWSNDKFGNELKEVDGYKNRLLTFLEAQNNSSTYIVNGYFYWLMNGNNIGRAYFVAPFGVAGSYNHPTYYVGYYNHTNSGFTVRPVINIKKTAVKRANNN